MLAPEVWSVKTKDTCSSVYTSEFKKYSIDSIDHLLKSSCFSHSVAFTISGDSNLSDDLIKVFETDNEYYLISDVTVAEFYDSLFISSFIKKGKLSVISIEDDIHSTNGFTITPNGLLVMKLLEEPFSCLGIEGKRIQIWNNDHYVITLDLNKKEIITGKLYERYRKCLINANLRFDVILIWEPHESSICPSSIASYFCKKAHKVSLCRPKHTFVKKFEESIPNPFLTEPEEFLHWYGVHLIDANKHVKSKESLPKVNIITHKWTGFFSSTQVLSLWKYLRSREETANHQWFSFYLSSFQNSPSNFVSCPRINVNSDDFITIFCNKDYCVVYPALPIKKT